MKLPVSVMQKETTKATHHGTRHWQNSPRSLSCGWKKAAQSRLLFVTDPQHCVTKPQAWALPCLSVPASTLGQDSPAAITSSSPISGQARTSRQLGKVHSQPRDLDEDLSPQKESTVKFGEFGLVENHSGCFGIYVKDWFLVSLQKNLEALRYRDDNFWSIQAPGCAHRDHRHSWKKTKNLNIMPLVLGNKIPAWAATSKIQGKRGSELHTFRSLTANQVPNVEPILKAFSWNIFWGNCFKSQLLQRKWEEEEPLTAQLNLLRKFCILP